MKAIIDITLLALVVIYIVDLSGFTQSWRSGLARLLKVQALRPLKPLDCGQCMTWWTTLVYALATGNASVPVVAYCALLAFLSYPLGQLLNGVKEGLLWIITKLTPRW